MAISAGQILTWSDFASMCFASMKAACCNIDNISSVPQYLRAGTGNVRVATVQLTYKVPDQAGNDNRRTYTYGWDAVPKSGLISVVSSATVNTEWTNFLKAAKILDSDGDDTRVDTLVSAKDLTLAIGLYMQFIAYHVKPVYSKRQIYNSVSAQTTFIGNKYVTGTVTPKYTLLPQTDVTAAEISNDDLTNIINQNLDANQLMKHYNNTAPYYCQIAGAGQV